MRKNKLRKNWNRNYCLTCKEKISIYKIASAVYCSKTCSGVASQRRYFSKYGKRNESRGFRKIILELLGNKCSNCESIDNLQVDHIIPISNGGVHEFCNLQALCVKCHRKKTTIEQSKKQC